MVGIYIHIPFCKTKCPYCDFYSFKADDTQKDSYLTAVLSCLKEYSAKVTVPVNTVYFGGGTPSCFGGERIKRVIGFIKNNYELTCDAEITVECNPSSVDEALVYHFASTGVNRISMGMQSAVSKERQALGRLSGPEQIKTAVELFKAHGIDNISLDLMLGIPHQTKESLKQSIDFASSLKVRHISAYMLKIEEGTVFKQKEKSLPLPDEDEVCELYLYTVKELKKLGYCQYEISNFAQKGFESRHNLKYWHCEEYLGIGPSAHSFLKGRRFYYERNFEKFLHSPIVIDDGDGGDEEEYIMLALRLTEGLRKKDFEKRFGKPLNEKLLKKAENAEKEGLLSLTDDGIHLTEKGFLLSNSVISYLLD